MKYSKHILFTETYIYLWFKLRPELAAVIESNGGKMLSSISAKLSYLVAGDKMGPSKLAKAEKLGIPMINDKELFELINPK